MELTKKQRFLWGGLAILVLLYAMFPVISILATSFKPAGELNSGSFLPENWTIANYLTILAPDGNARDLFLPALRNSIGITLIATAVATVLATLASYAIVRFKFPGKSLVLTLTLTVSIFPAISVVTPLFSLWRTIGLYDTWAGLVIPYLSLTLPISIWTLTAFFRQIPWDLEQAASIDGATRWESFRYVIAPLAVPGIATTALIAFFTAWNDFVYGISLTSTDAARTVPAALSFFTGASQFEEPAGAISAAAIVVTIPVVILVVLFQRQIVSGLTQGAVKG